MKTILLVLLIVAGFVGCNGCKGNRDEDYIHAYRQVKVWGKQYWDSVNRLADSMPIVPLHNTKP